MQRVSARQLIRVFFWVKTKQITGEREVPWPGSYQRGADPQSYHPGPHRPNPPATATKENIGKGKKEGA